MPQTITDVLKAERQKGEPTDPWGEAWLEGWREGWRAGRKEGRINTLQDILIRQLRQRFLNLPASVEKVIRATRQIKRLNGWLSRLLSAKSLKDMGIVVKP
jgi:hypothetical protein